MSITKADEILNGVYDTLGLSTATVSEKYAKVLEIVTELEKSNSKSKIAVGTTGTISERLCKLGIDAVLPLTGKMRPYGTNWKWLGDFLLPGEPYDIAVSVKSFKAKERLLASGTGSFLTPTIGWGLLNDSKEWSEDRSRSYLYRGFVAIYMPELTLNKVGTAAKKVLNINGKPLLRNLGNFSQDLFAAIPNGKERIDARRL